MSDEPESAAASPGDAAAPSGDSAAPSGDSATPSGSAAPQGAVPAAAGRSGMVVVLNTIAIVGLLALMFYQIHLIRENLRNPSRAQLAAEDQTAVPPAPGPPPPLGNQGPQGPPPAPGGAPPGPGGPSPAQGGPPPGQPGAGPQGGTQLDTIPLPALYGLILKVHEVKATALTPQQVEKVVGVIEKSSAVNFEETTQEFRKFTASVLRPEQLEYVAKSLPEVQPPPPTGTGQPQMDGGIAATMDVLAKIAGVPVDSVQPLESLVTSGTAMPQYDTSAESLSHRLPGADKLPDALKIGKEQAVKLLAAYKTYVRARQSYQAVRSELLAALDDSQRAALVTLAGTRPRTGGGPSATEVVATLRGLPSGSQSSPKGGT